MSQPSRPQARRPEQPRRKRRFPVESLQALEQRALLAPVVSFRNPTVTSTDISGNASAFEVRVSFNTTPDATLISDAATTGVSMLTEIEQFGGDMVRIEAGPGGPFGRAVYAISRGAPGDPNDSTNPVNRPGVIYRVDPATGKSSVFFDLNTVIPQLDPIPPGPQTTPQNASNDALSVATGLANWYDLTFDTEGYFDGKPSLFVASVDDLDPRLNSIFRIAPDGTLMQVFTTFTEGLAAGRLTINPSAVLVPPPEQQAFLRGLFAGDADSTDTLFPGGNDDFPRTDFEALFFDSNQFRPTQRVDNKDFLPVGVSESSLRFGPQVAINSANPFYFDTVYSTFTDFGTPNSAAGPGIPGLSGIEGITGFETGVFRFLIGPSSSLASDSAIVAANLNPDAFDAIITPYRRFQDTTFDKFGFFSFGETIAANSVLGPNTYAGSVFTADLGTGLSVFLPRPTQVAPLTYPQNFPAGISIPVIGDSIIGVQATDDNQDGATGPEDTDGVISALVYSNFPIAVGNRASGLFGPRVVRIDPNGTVRLYAEHFNGGELVDANGVTELYDPSQPYFVASEPTTGGGGFFYSQQPILTAPSFFLQNISLSFSADGTILYVADNDGIWQFKTTESLANSHSGSLVGLGDLRNLGVPYDGRDSAVAVVDSGVTAAHPNFRGRVARGINFGARGRGPGDNDVLNHGTQIAGIIHQFVPEATLLPVNIFQPFNLVGGAGNASTTVNAVYRGLEYITKNPFVNDPIRPNKQDRVIATNLGFGTAERLFSTEGEAFKRSPQAVIALKNQLHKLRNLGIGITAPTGHATTGPGDVQAASLPGILNEVVSVGGVYGFPFEANARTTPLDDTNAIASTASLPVRLFPLGVPNAQIAPLIANEVLTAIFADRIVGVSNRTYTTDFVAPMLELPTFGPVINGGDRIIPTTQPYFSGTSGASAVVTGSYALTASAIDYWEDIRKEQGFTDDAYLNVPVGTRTLDFGVNGVRDLSVYATPDGINSILQWTAVPTADIADAGTTLTPPTLIGRPPRRGETSIDDASPGYRNYSRIDVGNAIAAIEGSVALSYLISNDQVKLLDANSNGLITAQELQDFVDTSNRVGVPEAGAMARLLGGTTQPDFNERRDTFFGERPDPFETLQRRFNFFDYAADGQLDGILSTDQLNTLVHNLLPPPDSFVVVDRTRASANGYLLAPDAPRTYRDLQKLNPSFVFVAKDKVKKFRNISPASFGVQSREIGEFSLFSENRVVQKAAKNGELTASRDGSTSQAAKITLQDAAEIKAVKDAAAAAEAAQAAEAAAAATQTETPAPAAPAATASASQTGDSSLGKASAPAGSSDVQNDARPEPQSAQSQGEGGLTAASSDSPLSPEQEALKRQQDLLTALRNLAAQQNVGGGLNAAPVPTLPSPSSSSSSSNAATSSPDAVLAATAASAPASATASRIAAKSAAATAEQVRTQARAQAQTRAQAQRQARSQSRQLTNPSQVAGGERAQLIVTTLHELANKPLPQRRSGLLALNQDLVARGYRPFQPQDGKKETVAEQVLGPTVGKLFDKIF